MDSIMHGATIKKYHTSSRHPEILDFSDGLITPADKLCLQSTKLRVRSPTVSYEPVQITLRPSATDFPVRIYLQYPYRLIRGVLIQSTYSNLN